MGTDRSNTRGQDRLARSARSSGVAHDPRLVQLLHTGPASGPKEGARQALSLRVARSSTKATGITAAEVCAVACITNAEGGWLAGLCACSDGMRSVIAAPAAMDRQTVASWFMGVPPSDR